MYLNISVKNSLSFESYIPEVGLNAGDTVTNQPSQTLKVNRNNKHKLVKIKYNFAIKKKEAKELQSNWTCLKDVWATQK